MTNYNLTLSITNQLSKKVEFFQTKCLHTVAELLKNLILKEFLKNFEIKPKYFGVQISFLFCCP
jgi:hypothetical protein